MADTPSGAVNSTWPMAMSCLCYARSTAVSKGREDLYSDTEDSYDIPNHFSLRLMTHSTPTAAPPMHTEPVHMSTFVLLAIKSG